VQGAVEVSGGKVLVQDVTGKHGAATVKVSGSGSVKDMDWDLKLSGDGLVVDDELRKAMPTALAGIMNSMKLTGTLGLDFTKLRVRQTVAATQPASGHHSSTTTPADTPVDIDFVANVKGSAVAMDIGMPLTEMTPAIELAGTIRNSKLDSLAGPFDSVGGKISGMAVRNVHLELFKPPGRDALRVANVRARVAGGELAGQIDVAFPNETASRYQMNFVVKGANCRELTGDQQINGELNASLGLEGDFTNPASRRGRGDVSVTGKSLYKMPLVLGLLQVTNLSLPISSPFNEGSSRYSVDGQKVTFESIEVRSKDMLISGSGQMDFGTKKVDLTFTTDNPNWPKVPILGDIMQTAKHELLQIHVRGTLQEPKVSAGAMGTVTTTVDEVFKGNGK
jgi:hypothetical protein